MVVRGLAVVAVTVALAACGGGGGNSSGGGGSAPVGSTTPQGSFLLPASSSNNSTVIAANNANGGSTVVRYTSGGSGSVSFGGTTTTWRGTPTVQGDVEVTESNDGRTVVVTKRRGAAGSTALEYTSYGVWLQSSASGVLSGTSGEVTSASSFVIGDPTPVSAMPQSGTASYRGQAVAVELRDGQVPRTLSGPLNATVDFGQSRLNATTDLAAANGASFGRITMSNVGVSGNQFSGAATSATHTGTVSGGFAGPAAAELGGTFELNGPSTVHGAFAGTSR